MDAAEDCGIHTTQDYADTVEHIHGNYKNCERALACKAVLIAPGQHRLLMATSDLTSVAMTNKKAEPGECGGVCRYGNSQKQ